MGCTNCIELNKCPDAFSEVSPYCNNFNGWGAQRIGVDSAKDFLKSRLKLKNTFSTYILSSQEEEWYGYYMMCGKCGCHWMGPKNFCPGCGTSFSGE